LKFHELGIGTEARDLAQSTGLLNGLYIHFSVFNFIRGLLVPLVSFIYAGSWSLVRAPLGIYLLLALIYCITVFYYVKGMLRSKDRSFLLMPCALAISLYAGLAYHVLVSMALSGLGTSGGWYLYILTPWLLLSISVAAGKMPKFLSSWMQILGLIIGIGLFFVNALIYSGLIIKADDKGMKLIGMPWSDLVQTAFMRLNYVNYPALAVCFFVAGSILAIYTLCKTK
jgi:hypothetical protein